MPRLSSIALRVLPSLLILAGCSDPPVGPPKEITKLPRPLTAAEQQVSVSGNAFTFALLRQINAVQAGENVFISPLSASMALGMTMNGASGATFDAMRSTLGFDATELEDINRGYQGLIALLRELDPSTDIRIANSIWYRNGFPANTDFVSAMTGFFGARISPLDFSSSTAPATINDWVKTSTAGKIDKIVDQIGADVMMYLINAIYFKGSWRMAFDRSNTRDGTFRLADGTTQPIRMMSQSGNTLRIAYNPDFRSVDLLYGNSAFAMTILVPNGPADVNDLVAKLSTDKWNDWMTQFHEAKATLALPKFTLKYERELNDDLKALGMAIAFDENDADFSRMSPLGADLYISKVKQKTYVDVHEEGTEAAAVTSVEISVTSAPPAIVVDRPFVFAIRERLTGTILFIGKIMEIP
jgi:serpin B